MTGQEALAATLGLLIGGRIAGQRRKVNKITYNLSQLAGKVVFSAIDGSGLSAIEDTYTYTEYPIGAFPLVFDTYCDAKNYYLNLRTYFRYGEMWLYPLAKAGDHVEVEYTRPNYSLDYVTGEYMDSFNIYLVGNSENGTAYSPGVHVYTSDSSYVEDKIANGNDTVSDEPLMADDFESEYSLDDNGVIKWFRFSGTLLYDIKWLHISPRVKYESLSTAALTGTMRTEFSSYDDVKITVTKGGQ